MKKQICITAAFIAATIIPCILQAQETSDRTTKSRSNIQNNRVKVEAIDEGCAISFHYNVKSPRDAASGQASGKRQHKPFYIVQSIDNSIAESSQKEMAIKTASNRKASESTVTDLKAKWVGSDNKPINLLVEDGEITIPAVPSDGDCDMILSWSWGVSNSGSRACAVKFTLTFKDGVLFAINEQGIK